jgi:hypothetical protein
VSGSTGTFSGSLLVGGTVGVTTLTIGGSLSAQASTGGGDDSGQVNVVGRVGTMTVGGVSGGVGARSGSIFVGQDIGALTIKGDVVGLATNPVFITAQGQATPDPAKNKDSAIGSLIINGRVENANIEGGYGLVGGVSTLVNADAQIGTVSVGGDWIASNLVAGVNPGPDHVFGTADDFAPAAGGGVTNNTSINSMIGNVTIKGQAMGTVGGTDHFGIVAQQIGTLKVGTVTYPAIPPTGDSAKTKDVPLGSTGDFTEHTVTTP